MQQSHPVQAGLLQRGVLQSSDVYYQQAAARPEQRSKDCAADAITEQRISYK